MLVHIRTILRRTSASRKEFSCAPPTAAQLRRLSLDAAYSEVTDGVFRASQLTHGPWHPGHQHAGPPSALICRAIERAAAKDGLTHLGRLTVNLLRPTPIGECGVEVATDYVGRNAGHYSGRFIAGGKECARFTALMQREEAAAYPRGNAGPSPARRAETRRPMPGRDDAFHRPLVRLRRPGREPARGGAVLQRPLCRLVSHERSAGRRRDPKRLSARGRCRRFGNGICAALDFAKYVFINCDLTIRFLRRPEGEWICLEARSFFGENGCGLAEFALYDERGMIGRATQGLAVRRPEVGTGQPGDGR